MEFIDISSGLFSSPVYPGDPEPKKQQISSVAEGADCNLSAYYACAHTGSHADAPLHFIENGISIDQMPLAPFIGPCTVIELDEGPITGEFVEQNFPRGCRRVLIKSSGKAWFMDHGAYAASNLEYFLIGTDALSVGCSGGQVSVHKAFLSNKIAILEGLDLSQVEPGHYFLIALPIKLDGLEAAPVRAILIKDGFSWGRAK